MTIWKPVEFGDPECGTVEDHQSGRTYIVEGTPVYFKAHTGKYIDAQKHSLKPLGVAFNASSAGRGRPQQFEIKKVGSCRITHAESQGGKCKIMPGDTVYLKDHTGKYIDAEGTASATQTQAGSQQFIIDTPQSRLLSMSSFQGFDASGCSQDVASASL